jgi:DNA-directed RNA polymerase specialized sigma24 family protein
LAHRSGYSHAEIADHMNIAKITVERHIARARAVLMKVDD